MTMNLDLFFVSPVMVFCFSTVGTKIKSSDGRNEGEKDRDPASITTTYIPHLFDVYIN